MLDLSSVLGEKLSITRIAFFSRLEGRKAKTSVPILDRRYCFQREGEPAASSKGKIATSRSQLACPTRCNLKLPSIRTTKHNQEPNHPGSQWGDRALQRGCSHTLHEPCSPEHTELLCLNLGLLNTSRRPGLSPGRALAELWLGWDMPGVTQSAAHLLLTASAGRRLQLQLSAEIFGEIRAEQKCPSLTCQGWESCVSSAFGWCCLLVTGHHLAPRRAEGSSHLCPWSPHVPDV